MTKTKIEFEPTGVWYNYPADGMTVEFSTDDSPTHNPDVLVRVKFPSIEMIDNSIQTLIELRESVTGDHFTLEKVKE